MNVLFVHDHIFKKKADEYYSSGGLPKEVWQRYLSFAKTLTVIGRDGGQLHDSEQGFSLSSTEDVNFVLLPNASSFKNFIFGNKHISRQCSALVSHSDAVIVRLPSRLGTIFAKEAIKQNKPLAFEVVGCPWDALWNYGSLKAKFFAPYATFELKRIVRKAHFVLYVTETFLQNRYPAKEKTVVTFCSNVEIPRVNQVVLEKRQLFIKKLFNREKIVFGLIGNYSSKYKGIDVAIKSLAEARFENWEFQVLGNGDASTYQHLAKEFGVQDKVKFIGSLPSGLPVFDWLDTIDIYLHPSFQEGLPRALAEAMSRGCPAIASNTAGIPELLPEQWMIDAGDSKSLASKIEQLSKDVDLQLHLSEQNFNRAKSYYKPVLDERRTEFWRSFRSYVEGSAK